MKLFYTQLSCQLEKKTKIVPRAPELDKQTVFARERFRVICIASKHQRPTFGSKLIFSNTKWPKHCQLSGKVADIGDARLGR